MSVVTTRASTITPKRKLEDSPLGGVQLENPPLDGVEPQAKLQRISLDNSKKTDSNLNCDKSINQSDACFGEEEELQKQR